MGQINSTRGAGRRNSAQSAAVRQVSENTVDINEASPRPDSRPNDSQRDRRKLLRNSIVGLVNSKSSRNLGEESPRGSKESKRWWQKNRRQSNVQLLPQLEPQGRETSRSADPPSHIQAPTSNQPAFMPVPSEGTQPTNDSHEARGAAVERHSSDVVDDPDNASKGKEREMEIPDTVTEDQQANLAQGSSTMHGVDNYPSAGIPAVPNSDLGGDSGLLPHHSMEGGSGTQTSSLPSGNSAMQPPSNDNIFRQFPPSGTLVVVQGVVHTDTILRTTRSATATTSNAGGTSPSSAMDARQDDSESLLAQPEASADASSSQETSSLTNSGSITNAIGRDTSENLYSTEPSSVGVSGNSRTRGSSNDSHGPDILGALLSIVSVATAAAATSLLSAPNAPSSLPRPSSALATSSPPAVNGSNLPLIARALASANPAAAAVIARREREREEREQNRVRALWEALRDRVSSNGTSRSTATAASRSHNFAISSGGDRIGDTSLNLDSLLDELARAFNLGPTPDERASDAQSAWSAHPRTEPVQEGPSDHQTASDSETNDLSNAGFEQFLIDLQSDLRLELTRPDSDTDVVSTTQLNQNDDREDSRILPEVTRNDETDESSMSSVSPPPVAICGSGESMTDDSLTLPQSSATETTTSIDMANSDDHLSNVGNPESAIRTDNHNMSRHGVSEGPIDFQTVNQARRRNGINWWRMHRFPPIQPRQDNLGYNALHSEAIRASNAAISNGISGPIPSSPGETQQNSDVVIPVIIVGLQSLGSRRTQPDAHRRRTDEIEARSERGHRTEDTEYGPQVSAELRRPRDSWSSRAARAFGRLGRRDASIDREPEVPSNNDNARTILIYVFGGHYPPDHHILSGLGDADSFEALWDLAEFLGQVKPPVVTEEEIERSGLELFKAKLLKEFEASDRVASNCVDRCLVCLENYESNDDLRLLMCKHAFHKVCVDRWLKTGRNNCPACRREGVSTGNIPSQQSA